jgi:hypothetical protein
VTINGTLTVGTKLAPSATDAVLIIDRPLRLPGIPYSNTRKDDGWGINDLRLGAAVSYYIIFYY